MKIEILDTTKGVVKVLYQMKGYGFITREKGKDVFFHFTDIDSAERDATIFEGDTVEFVLASKDGKPRALKVKRVG